MKSGTKETYSLNVVLRVKKLRGDVKVMNTSKMKNGEMQMSATQHNKTAQFQKPAVSP